MQRSVGQEFQSIQQIFRWIFDLPIDQSDSPGAYEKWQRAEVMRFRVPLPAFLSLWPIEPRPPVTAFRVSGDIVSHSPVLVEDRCNEKVAT